MEEGHGTQVAGTGYEPATSRGILRATIYTIPPCMPTRQTRFKGRSNGTSSLVIPTCLVYYSTVFTLPIIVAYKLSLHYLIQVYRPLPFSLMELGVVPKCGYDPQTATL